MGVQVHPQILTVIEAKHTPYIYSLLEAPPDVQTFGGTANCDESIVLEVIESATFYMSLI